MNRHDNKRQLKKISRILSRINDLADEMKALSDEELQGKTAEFKAILREETAKGRDEQAVLSSILPEAYAAVREAGRRVLGMFPYDVQVMGGIVLNEGRTAEMKTGEGKTLVATMPLYLNALTGKSCFLVTTNEYLAGRDGEQMSKLYEFMGLSCAVGVSPDPSVRLTPQDKKKIYSADIVYTTNSVLGFDYLLENLSASVKDNYLRPFYYVIIDEADSVLLDSAQTPLVIAGAPRVQSNLYDSADYFVTTLRNGVDYKAEMKNVWLTPEGIRAAEQFFGVPQLFGEGQFQLVRHIYLALRAHTQFERDKDYVVEDGKVELLDSETGRIMFNTKLRSGQHQALEAKEHVAITMDNRSMASITYQSFFNMFPKIAGMTGTGANDADEFRSIYGMDVTVIPTRKGVNRIDYPDLVYPNLKSQMQGALKEVIELHQKHQPVLLITSSIEMSDIFSEMLLQQGIPHNVLNAYNTAKEASIIKEAGQMDAVTVATSVAGRGTDIKLGEGVRELGGLAVLGIGRMDNVRQELQARGRSGRQGDPGFSRFYVSLDDDVVIEHGAEWLDDWREGTEPITSRRVWKAVQEAQRINEDIGRANRKSTMEYGESIQRQRNLIYGMRSEIQREKEKDLSYYLKMEEGLIDDFLNEKKEVPSENEVLRYAMDNIVYELGRFPQKEEIADKLSVRKYLNDLALVTLQEKMKQLTRPDTRKRFFDTMTLRAIDGAWVEQVDYLQQLRGAISGRAYAQRNNEFEFHQEAYKAFLQMEKKVKKDMMRNIFLGELQRMPDGSLQVLFP